MPHSTPLIATIVAGLVLAFIFGAIAQRLRMPPLIGYLIGGIVVGPYTPGFVADQHLATELAELGVILLMFGVGLHFSMRDLLSVKAIAVPGAIVQMGVATLLGLGLALLLGWGLGAGVVFGLALSVASTVVLLRALQERRLIETEKGRIAVGWLIVEDLAMVLALVLLPALAPLLGGSADAGGQNGEVATIASAQFGLWGILGLTLFKVVAFVVVMLVVGRRVIPWVLHYVAHTGSRELFRLAVLAIALGVAFGAAHLFGVSLALGAFFAGMIMSESELSHRAAEESLPLRDAFSVLFFVSVGMLFDPMSVLADPLPMLATVLIIIAGKSVVAFFIVMAFRHTVPTALVISASLAQIGEFSFILASLGVALNLLPQEGQDLILGGAIISIVLNPLIFVGVDHLRPELERRWATWRKTPQSAPASEEIGDLPPAPVNLETGDPAPAEPQIARADLDDAPPPTQLSSHIILVGYGRVGKLIAQKLKASGETFLIIEDSELVVERVRADGFEGILGNAARADILASANVGGAKRMVIAIPNAFEAGPIITRAKMANSALKIVARAHTDAEVEHLITLGANTAIMGERELARGMVVHVLDAQLGQDKTQDTTLPSPDLPVSNPA